MTTKTKKAPKAKTTAEPKTKKAAEPQEFTLHIGGRKVSCSSLLDATGEYQHRRNLSGKGASEWPNGRVTRGAEEWTITYNGTVQQGGKTVMEADGRTPGAEPQQEPKPAPEPATTKQPKAKKEPAKKAKDPKPTAARTCDATATLATICDAFIDALARTKSEHTASSYRGDLAVARKALGDDTLASSLTTKKVRAFFDSDTVQKKRDGSPKSPISIAKTQRVLRQALTWAGLANVVPEGGAA